MSSDDHSGWGQGGDGALLDQVVLESLTEEVTLNETCMIGGHGGAFPAK